MLHRLGVLSDRQGDPKGALSLRQASLALCREMGDVKQMAHLLHDLGGIAADRGDKTLARALLEERLALTRDRSEPWAIAWNLMARVDLARDQCDAALTRRLYDEAAALSRQWRDHRLMDRAVGYVVRLAFERGDYATARTIAEETLAHRRTTEVNRTTVRFSLLSLARIARQQGDLCTARVYAEEGLGLTREVHDTHMTCGFLYKLGMAALELGNPAEAGSRLCESLAMCQQMGIEGMAPRLEGLAALALRVRQPSRAIRLLGAAAALREKANNPLVLPYRQEYDCLVSELRSLLDEAAFASAWATGRAMLMEDAVALALQETCAGDPT